MLPVVQIVTGHETTPEYRDARRDRSPLGDIEARHCRNAGWDERRYKNARVYAMQHVPKMAHATIDAIACAKGRLLELAPA